MAAVVVPIMRKRIMTLSMNIVQKVKNRCGFLQEVQKKVTPELGRRAMKPSGSTVILLLCFLLIADIGKCEEWPTFEECRKPLGMESYEIAAHQITASSSYNAENTGPQFSRIRQENGAGAWCPRPGIQHGVKEYLEIDLLSEFRITEIETQGRYGGGMGVEYAEHFQLEYWRDSLSKWILYKDHLGRNILDGNINTYTENKHMLEPSIIASKLRILPYSYHIRTVCMRIEVYGCQNKDGVVRYDIPQGYYRPNPELDFRDPLYDGIEDATTGTLRSGLGLLTDMKYAAFDFTRSSKGWIGWELNNDTDAIEIEFYFDNLRKFNSVTIHVNSFISQGAQVFSTATMHFSLDGGRTISPHTISFCPKKDLKNDTTILVEIPLFGRVASYIKMELEHSDEWLLLSEVSFRSDIFSGDTGNIGQIKSSWNGTGYPPSTTYHHECPEHSEKNKLVTVEQSTAAMIGLVVGCVLVCLLLSGVSVACFFMRRNRRNTKLVGVMGMGMTPKSMSIGLGLNGCPSGEQLSGSANVIKLSSQKLPGDHVSTMNGGFKTLGKIALCDMNPVSHSGETDSDESLYQDLIFGRNGPAPAFSIGKTVLPKPRKIVGAAGTLSSSSLAITTNNSGSVTSSCTSTAKTESDSGYGSSSQQLLRKYNSGMGSKKTKHQKINHGAEFSDVIIGDDEMTYYHARNQNLGQFDPASPYTGPRSKLQLGQSMGSISISSNHHAPPSPRLAFKPPLHHPHAQILFSNSNSSIMGGHNPISLSNHLTLGSKSISSANNNGLINMVSSRERSVNSFFNSPRTNSRRISSNNNHSNHPSAGVNTISAALSGHSNINCNEGLMTGTTNPNSFGVSLMKSSGLSACSNPSNHHLVGPLGICGEESNYYAATDIFQVPDKHFDRF